MITTPSPAEFIHSVRMALETHVAPSVTDPGVAAALAQAGLVLRYVETLIDIETEQLREEITDIHDTALRVIKLGADGDGAVIRALEISKERYSEAEDTRALRDSYQLASEVLSNVLEVSQRTGGDAVRHATGALRRRVGRETAIRVAAGLSYTSRIEIEETDK